MKEILSDSAARAWFSFLQAIFAGTGIMWRYVVISIIRYEPMDDSSSDDGRFHGEPLVVPSDITYGQWRSMLDERVNKLRKDDEELALSTQVAVFNRANLATELVRFNILDARPKMTYDEAVALGSEWEVVETHPPHHGRVGGYHLYPRDPANLLVGVSQAQLAAREKLVDPNWSLGHIRITSNVKDRITHDLTKPAPDVKNPMASDDVIDF